MSAAPIDTGRILRDLDELWVNLGKDEHGGAGSDGVLRACSMTLVVCTEGHDAELGETLALLMRDHPSRLIVVNLSESAAALTASVTAECWMPFGRKQQICCERIAIEIPEHAIGDAPSVARGLIAPDLPVAVWCRSRRLLHHPEFRTVVRLANKLIVDSSDIEDLAGRIATLRAFRDADTRVADLAWTRLTRWREAIAAIFDDPDYLSHLDAMDRVVLEYQGPHRPMSTCYLPAWLAHCLGRRFETRWYRAGDSPRPRLFRVALHGTSLDVAIKVEADRSVQMHTGTRDSHCVFPALGEYDLMREELAIGGEDPVFEAVLNLAPEFA